MVTTVEQRVKELHDCTVRQLVEAHCERKDDPLILAIRYKLDDPMNIHLLEVLRDFPGSDDDDLLDTEFTRAANLLILGSLHLILGSPGQLRTAIRRRDLILYEVRWGRVEYSDRSDEARVLLDAFGL